MYTVIYLYRVKQEHVQTVLDINEKVSEIYMANGALENTIYQADNLNGNHGCAGLLDIMELKEDEEILFEQSVYRNKPHYEEVLEHVNKNERITELFADITEIVDFSKVITASFTTSY